MFNIKLYLIIGLILLVLTSAILHSYLSYSMAYATDFEFKSDDATQANYLTIKDAAARKAGVSAASFWNTNKYLIHAPPLLNVAAGLIGAYLLMF